MHDTVGHSMPEITVIPKASLQFAVYMYLSGLWFTCVYTLSCTMHKHVWVMHACNTQAHSSYAQYLTVVLYTLNTLHTLRTS